MYQWSNSMFNHDFLVPPKWFFFRYRLTFSETFYVIDKASTVRNHWAISPLKNSISISRCWLKIGILLDLVVPIVRGLSWNIKTVLLFVKGSLNPHYFLACWQWFQMHSDYYLKVMQPKTYRREHWRIVINLLPIISVHVSAIMELKTNYLKK